MARGPGPSPHTATDIYGHGNPIADTETGTKTRGHRGLHTKILLRAAEQRGEAEGEAPSILTSSVLARKLTRSGLVSAGLRSHGSWSPPTMGSIQTKHPSHSTDPGSQGMQRPHCQSHDQSDTHHLFSQYSSLSNQYPHYLMIKTAIHSVALGMFQNLVL